jgi:hypothetical protein
LKWRCRLDEETDHAPVLTIDEIMLEAKNWNIVVELYEGHPIPALLLAHQLMAIKQSLERGRKGIPDAIAGLDLAIEALFPHSDFYKVSHRFVCGDWRETSSLSKRKNSVNLV